MVTDAAINPGTSVTNAIESALAAAMGVFDLDASTEAFEWTPNDPAVPNSLWRITFDDQGPVWERVEWEQDPHLRGATAALEVAAGGRTTDETRRWLIDDQQE